MVRRVDYSDLLANVIDAAWGHVLQRGDAGLPPWNLPLLPKQAEFLEDNTHRHLLYSGAFGAGKTRGLCIKLRERARMPGAREGLVRKHLTSLKSSTLKTLLEWDGELPPVLPPGSYTHNKQEKSIRIIGGGEILYFGIDDPDKIGSYNLTGCAVDEVVELTEKDYTQLNGRCRLSVTGVFNQLYGCCNPGPPAHFLARRFALIEGRPGEPMEASRAIRTCSADNTYLTDDYQEDLMRMEGVMGLRYRDGLWVGSEGMVYPNYSDTRNVRVVPDPELSERYFLLVDDGFTNPFAVLRCHVDADGGMHIAHEEYERGLLLKQKLKMIRRAVWTKELPRSSRKVWPEAVIIDPSAAGLKAEVTNALGMEVVDADNEVLSGLERVRHRLTAQHQEVPPRLTFDPGCIMCRTEHASYERKEDRANGGFLEIPKKKDDHTCDAVRYGANHLAEEEWEDDDVFVVGR